MTGIATILGVETYAVGAADEGIDLEALQEAIQHIKEQGKTPRALYLVPDFNNPLGTSLPLAERQRLLRIAHEENMLIFEDNPYGMLAYDGDSFPTLKALDQWGVVVYLGTFSKLLFPGLRVGFMLADQRIANEDGEAGPYLAQELSKVKSLISVNTSPVTQAMIGGFLLEHDCSLKSSLTEKKRYYRANRDQLLQSLEQHFGSDPVLADRVSWNYPHGGLFLTVTLPFVLTPQLLQQCVQEYHVIVCPLSFFTLLPGRERQVRLSFSAVTQQEIATGVARFQQFIRSHTSP
ncbi:hypothetical protein KDW_58850 [Dictyobacter vulcani]|uniref:Aminotransferase class I/classII large domain-containing protein n=1 Tax=Dictyobacter vulcani TaxID=2607529 RepID=A0A5J4KW42_9CHLR|nr:PLP-dependent aminotransferase family protein [Dictyobacter vulcani]GER91723.1 hypothetical protein KDW_58850 [Dictyobacter vulcani]